MSLRKYEIDGNQFDLLKNLSKLSLNCAPTQSLTQRPIQSSAQLPIQSLTQRPIQSPAQLPIQSLAQRLTKRLAQRPTQSPAQCPTQSSTKRKTVKVSLDEFHQELDQDAIQIWRRRPCESVWRNYDCDNKDCKLTHFRNRGKKLDVCFNYLNSDCKRRCSKVHIKKMKGRYKEKLCYYAYVSNFCAKHRKYCLKYGEECKYWKTGKCQHKKGLAKTCQYIHPC
jgi:hypothetical protein